MLVIGREPRSLRAINVSGGFGFLHDLLDLAGGDNVFGDVKRESMLVSTETILARQPEVIIELHYSDRRVARGAERANATRGSCCRASPRSRRAASTCSTAANLSCPAPASSSPRRPSPGRCATRT